MTYEKILTLKFKQGLSTYELAKRFPSDIGRVSEVALLDIPDSVLKEILKETKEFNRLMRLKKRLSRIIRS